jgi:hypothetical protein
MSVEEFEELERHAPETVRLEFVNGRVQVKPVTDGNHDQIIAWLQRLCMQHRPELWLYGDRGMKVESYREGLARPDGLLAPFGFPTGHGNWSDAGGVLMAAEVTSHDSDTHPTASRSPMAMRPPASPSTSSSTVTTARWSCSTSRRTVATVMRRGWRSGPP